jgi:hypothetical protein
MIYDLVILAHAQYFEVHCTGNAYFEVLCTGNTVLQ